jgi:DNA (cytosine-5)-methyltransferase 1
VYLVASRCDIDPEAVLLADDIAPPKRATALDTHAHGFYWTEGVRGLGWAPDAVPTLKNGSTVGIPSPPAILMPSGVVIKPDIRDAERLQGFPEDWTSPAERAGRASLRWALVGNAVSAPVAGWLGERLNEVRRYDTARDAGKVFAGNWPRAARGDGRGATAVTIGAFPVYADRPALHTFLRYEGDPLSARATRGFLGRTDVSTLRFMPGFRERVRAHLEAVERPALAAE